MDRSELRDLVFARDHGCMGVIAEHETGYPAEERHRCTGPLTLEHVTMVHSITEGKVDNEAHCVALCAGLNGSTLRLAPHWMKEWFRDYLKKTYPELVYPTCQQP